MSAGILLVRPSDAGTEVLLGHPGGVWSIPKGRAEAGEELLAVAKREFREETRHVVGSSPEIIAVGFIK